MAEQRRVKINITISTHLLAAVDAEAGAQRATRSRVIDEALTLWHAGQRRDALAQQHTMPLSAAQQQESDAWDAVLDVAARDMLVDATGH